MPGDFQTYFPKVYGFRPHMRHIRTSGMADSEFFQRHSDQLLDRSRGRFAQNAPQNLLGRGAGEAQHGQRRKGLVEAPARPGLRPSVVGARRHELAAQLDDDLLRRLEAQPLDVFQQHGVARRDDSLQLARRISRKDHTRRVAAHARNADQQAEQLALGFGREAVEQLRILAHDVMDVEPGLGLVFDRGVGFERNMEVVAHPADVDNCVSGSHFGDCALDVFVHVFQILLRVGQK